MISHEHKCIFVHIPRTGGTSIEEVIWGWPRTPDQLWMGFVDEYRNKYQTDGLQHLLPSQIKMEVGAEIFDRYFKFAFVRNPFDRLVSQYRYMEGRPDLRRLIGMSIGDSFSVYLSLIQKTPHAHWEPQHRFVFDDNGKLLVNRICRFENFKEDARGVLAQIGLADRSFPHINKTVRLQYRNYYDDATRAFATVLYARDLELFGYSFS
jgi:hypothetical protein